MFSRISIFRIFSVLLIVLMMSGTASARPLEVITNLLQDPSFEAYTPSSDWTEASANFVTPLCEVGDCGTSVYIGPHTGSVWAWFGGTILDETASLSQTIVIPTGAATLQFYLWIGYAGPGSSTDDVFNAKMDGVTVFAANATQAGSYTAYTLVNIDVGAYADGGSHTVTFSSVTTGQAVDFNLDDVAILVDNDYRIYLPLVLKNYPPAPDAFNKSAPADGATGQPANPTLSWAASSLATSYEYCFDASNNSACDASWISTGASTSVGLSGLAPATYYWQVRANNAYGTTYANGGTWWSFTTAASNPPAGFWLENSGSACPGCSEFYVTPDLANVANFKIRFNVSACGLTGTTTHTSLVPIVGNQFSFSGSFFATGTLDSATSAHGTTGLSNYSIPGVCSNINALWSWTSSWSNSSQPAPQISGAEAIPSVIFTPGLQVPNFHIINQPGFLYPGRR